MFKLLRGGRGNSLLDSMTSLGEQVVPGFDNRGELRAGAGSHHVGLVLQEVSRLSLTLTVVWGLFDMGSAPIHASFLFLPF